MRRTISQRNFFPTSSGSSAAAPSGSAESRESTNRESPPRDDQSNKKVRKTGIAKVVAEHAMVIVAVRGCFMCDTVNDLVQKWGVNAKIVEVEEAEKTTMLVQLSKIDEDGREGPCELPAVYVGGKLLGGVDKVMEAHVNGEFVPMLRAAGALWL